MNTQSHEQLLQMLSTLLIQINALQARIVPIDETLDSAALSEDLRILEHMARDILYLVRAWDEKLPLPALEGVTLAEALSRLIEEAAEAQGISSRVALSGVEEQGKPQAQSLPIAAERLLYLIAQEALYEVRQHQGARRLRLALNYGQDDVQMSIEDDGNPLVVQEPVEDLPPPPFTMTMSEAAPPSPPTISILHDLRSRLECLGGSLESSAASGQGTRITARVPYNGAGELTGAGLVAHVEARKARPDLADQPDASIRILIVDSLAVTRAGLHRLLESYPGLQVIGEAVDGVQAVSEALELGPQVVLMDTQLPNGQSLEALRQIKQLSPDARVLLLSAQDREEYLYETLRAGADGYVLKDIAPDELAEAVRAVARGEVLIQPQLAGRLLSRFGKQGRSAGRYDILTTRELEVLRLLARGLRNKEIAARLYVSERTVNFHLANIYQKLNVSGRTEALSRALEQGLITA